MDEAKTTGMMVGVISDTHGLLRPEAVEALRGSDLILHAGDIGKPEVLAGLRAIAPVVAIRGNIDKEAWAETIPEREALEIGGVWTYLLHALQELDFEPAATDFRLVISGHSHRPGVEERGGVLFVNPGSAGPRRFQLPVSVASLHISAGVINAQILRLLE